MKTPSLLNISSLTLPLGSSLLVNIYIVPRFPVLSLHGLDDYSINSSSGLRTVSIYLHIDPLLREILDRISSLTIPIVLIAVFSPLFYSNDVLICRTR